MTWIDWLSLAIGVLVAPWLFGVWSRKCVRDARRAELDRIARDKRGRRWDD